MLLLNTVAAAKVNGMGVTGSEQKVCNHTGPGASRVPRTLQARTDKGKIVYRLFCTLKDPAVRSSKQI